MNLWLYGTTVIAAVVTSVRTLNAAMLHTELFGLLISGVVAHLVVAFFATALFIAEWHKSEDAE